METLKLNLENILEFVSQDEINNLKDAASSSNKALEDKSGKGNDFLGWVNLPSEITDADLADMEQTAAKLKSKSEVVVVVGIGGSYLGAKSIIEALSHSFSQLKSNDSPLVLFAGQNISEDYLAELVDILDVKDYSLVVISKSGTTTEPALAFRVLKQHIEKKYSKEEVKERIVAITDGSKGTLRQLADQEGYKTFVIPDDVGGRFSVLTPVGLVPIAVAGFDIRKFVEGAKHMQSKTNSSVAFEDNVAAQYAAARNALLAKGKITEIMVNYNPKLHFVAEWWKQLYGESEGKEGKGIFPASVDFTSDLHSMGQYIQEGIRNIFETVLSIKNVDREVEIPVDPANLDQLNFLAKNRVDYVNKNAEKGTVLAHIDGGVPNIQIEIAHLGEFCLGQLVYFYERACGISGYILDVNPFDQPGVEAYKRNMFILLKKPGYENETI